MARCKLPNCPVAVDGRCLEGRGADCPNLIAELVSAAAQGEKPQGATPEVPGPKLESLPGVLPLDANEARAFARRGRCVVVVLAGTKGCGKTSLLARIHQLFQAGPILDFDFAGSQSLPHFEERNWLATIESGVNKPKMARSSRKFDNSFIHVAVRSSRTGDRTEMLLNDISGETCTDAVAAQSVCDQLLGPRRADHLVMLVDGTALASPAQRYLQIDQVREFIQRVLQSGQCGTWTALHIVTSKADELAGVTSAVSNMEAEFTRLFGSLLGSVSFWRVAARPMNGTLPTVQQIKDLFSAWLTSSHRYPQPVTRPASREAWSRDYCRFGT